MISGQQPVKYDPEIHSDIHTLRYDPSEGPSSHHLNNQFATDQSTIDQSPLYQQEPVSRSFPRSHSVDPVPPPPILSKPNYYPHGPMLPPYPTQWRDPLSHPHSGIIVRSLDEYDNQRGNLKFYSILLTNISLA
jgi:hypothetical protein